jgi:Zn finger protein HypA/HybF involved in hydrogenase expression
MPEKTLKFVCPKCGSNSFGIRENREVWMEFEIEPGGNLDILDTAILSQKNATMECSDCEHICLAEDNDEYATSKKAILEWIEEHCPQD